MGRRIVISVEALLRANCTLVQKIIHHPAIDGGSSGQSLDAWDEHLLRITFPCGLEWLMDFCTHGDRVWVESDYGEHGLTFKNISPALAALNIPHFIH